jgi:hypothetical protein
MGLSRKALWPVGCIDLNNLIMLTRQWMPNNFLGYFALFTSFEAKEIRQE